ncbi:DUF6427 family protein [Maribacter arenosus]|uniref:EpsG family protein n=1 Tax=Maribacter arenosus TaxID=1854708 RepID=A0ABR7VAD4_9FLAO|nr:DUF6427 family protein [Maribacter arenosus]MBD0850582.1 hypothetical protein [Maribacter arenosus]
MITSIFGKTKPINYIIVLTFLFLFYWGVHFSLYDRVYEPEELLGQTFILGLLLFSVFIVNFVVKRNKITLANSYAILFYALLLVVFPETLTDNMAILSNFFVLLAIRRLISMRSLKKLKIKIFDASIWIMFASLFYDWAILFLLVVFIAIYIYEPKNFKNWLAPIAAIFAVLMISSAYLVLTDNLEFLFTHYQFSIQFDVGYYLNWASSSKLIIYMLLLFILTIMAFIKLGNSGIGKIVTTRLIVFSLIIGLILNVLISSEDLHPILLTFFPASVLMTSYVESIKRDNIKEIVLIFSILIPFAVFLSIIIL